MLTNNKILQYKKHIKSKRYSCFFSASALASFICHSMKKCRSYKTESNELDQSKDEHVENHYCDIDESAMIKTENLSEKSYENECML